jgi:hypothetical protein
MNSRRYSPARRTRASDGHRPDRDQRADADIDCVINQKSARDQRCGSDRLHGLIPLEANASRRLNFIKSESETKLHAETHTYPVPPACEGSSQKLPRPRDRFRERELRRKAGRQLAVRERGENFYNRSDNAPYYQSVPGSISQLLLRESVGARLYGVDEQLRGIGLGVHVHDALGQLRFSRTFMTSGCRHASVRSCHC